MTDAVYVYSGYALTAAVLGAYTAWIISRTRSLRRRLADEPRR
jgi:heme exporter protein CcmD